MSACEVKGENLMFANVSEKEVKETNSLLPWLAVEWLLWLLLNRVLQPTYLYLPDTWMIRRMQHAITKGFANVPHLSGETAVQGSARSW